jgi:hypothetical protein
MADLLSEIVLAGKLMVKREKERLSLITLKSSIYIHVYLSKENGPKVLRNQYIRFRDYLLILVYGVARGGRV